MSLGLLTLVLQSQEPAHRGATVCLPMQKAQFCSPAVLFAEKRDLLPTDSPTPHEGWSASLRSHSAVQKVSK